MSSSPNVLFALSAADRDHFLPGRRIEEIAPAVRWVDVTELDAEEWQQVLLDSAAEVMVTAWDTPVFPEALAHWPDLPLRYVCHMAGGVRFLPRTLLERGVLVSNWGKCVSHAVAEHALLLTLAALRNLPLWEPLLARFPSDRSFQLRTRTLQGKRIGLHGFGVIARQLVRLLQPFDPEISVYSAGVPQELYKRFGVRPVGSLEELFSHSEVLIECEALNARTRTSVTEAIINRLPEDAVFVNVGRGAVVDEPALVRRAAQGRVRLALDVFAQEPLPLDSRLFGIKSAVLSPHIAGPTTDTFSSCGAFALENLKRFLRGESVEGLVTIEAYDRSS